jgi:hypothetical protein
LSLHTVSTVAETIIYPTEIAVPKTEVALKVGPSEKIGVIVFEFVSDIFNMPWIFKPLNKAYSEAFFLAFSNAADLACLLANLVSFCENAKPEMLTPLIKEN